MAELRPGRTDQRGLFARMIRGSKPRIIHDGLVDNARKTCPTIEPTTDAPPQGTTWRVHLAYTAGRRKVGFVVAMILCAMGTAYLALGGAIPSVAVGFVLLASVGDFLFPVTYQITGESASSRSLFSRHIIKWHDVKACYLCDDGVKLSPLGRTSRLEACRGVYLRFPGDHHGEPTRTEVLAAIRSVWYGDMRWP